MAAVRRGVAACGVRGIACGGGAIENGAEMQPSLNRAEHQPLPARAAWAWGLGVLAVALLAYGPALSAGFIWDDQPGHVTRPGLRSLAGLWQIWAEPGATQQYYPLLHSFFWLQQLAWGDAPFGYHLVNVLLHATAACLFWIVLARLQVPGARLAALLFATHPVTVESVAWVSEQKNTLSAVLYLGAALSYLRFAAGRRAAEYALATALFALALLTKTVTATLPAALLLVRWWRHGRIEARRDVVPLVPWFGFAMAAGLVTLHFEKSFIGAAGAEFALSGADRVAIASRAPWFYLGKLLWPGQLVFIYPRWEVPVSVPVLWGFVGLTVALLGALWLARRRWPALLATALFFGGSLFPALGFFDVFPFRYSFVADHFQYLACLGPLALAAAALTELGRLRALWTGGAAVAALGVLTWHQAGTYRDGFTLYTATLARNPACWMAHNNLAEALANAGKPAEAILHLEEALRLRPDFPEALNNLGDDLTRLGRAAEALPHLERAIALQPGFAAAHNNRAIALARLGRLDEARRGFREALRLQPGHAQARFNLGLSIAQEGNPGDALPHFTEAIRLDPNYTAALVNRAIALTLTNRFAEAVPDFERALALEPDSAESHNHFGRALALVGRYDDAIAHGRRAVELDARNADAHRNLAHALRQVGRVEEAGRHYEQALRLAPPR